MKKKLSWFLVIFMLLAFLQYTVKAQELEASVTARLEANDEWLLTNRMDQVRSVEGRTGTRFTNLLDSRITGAGYRSRIVCELQILSGAIFLYLAAAAGKEIRRRIRNKPGEPVRMRAVRHIHFLYSL